MLKKVLPVLILRPLSLVLRSPLSDAAKKCAKITDKAKKEACLKKAKAKKK